MLIYVEPKDRRHRNETGNVCVLDLIRLLWFIRSRICTTLMRISICVLLAHLAASLSLFLYVAMSCFFKNVFGRDKFKDYDILAISFVMAWFHTFVRAENVYAQIFALQKGG